MSVSSTAQLQPFLKALKKELGNRLLPAIQPGMEQQIAMCSYRMLGRLIIDNHFLPALQQETYHQLSGLADAITDTLQGIEVSDAIALLQHPENQTPQVIESALQTIAAELISLSSPQATALLSQILKISHQMQLSLMEEYEREIALLTQHKEPPAVLDAGQQQRLVSFLQTQFHGNESLALGNIKAIPGGFSKQTIFIDLVNASELPASVVIRLDKADSPVDTTVVNEFNIIKVLYEQGAAVPQPFVLESSGDILGGAFMVVSRIHGENAGDALDVTAGSPALAKDIARQIARIHQVPATCFGNEVHGAATSIIERVSAEIAAFEQQWQAMQQPSLPLATAFAWLKANIHLADGPRALIHKDIGCHNMLAADTKVTAILDWETAAIGNPAQDLGYLYRTIVQMCDWDSFLQAYQAATGIELPNPQQIQFYRLWGVTWLNVMLASAAAAFKSGATDDIQLAYAGTYLLTRLQTQLTNELQQIFK